jgi:hypothetical protein
MIMMIIQCGDASLGDYDDTQVEKDCGQLVVLTDMSHGCHTGESRRHPVRCDVPAGSTSRMGTIVHDGDISTGHQLFSSSTESGRAVACDEPGWTGRIGGARDRCERVDCVILPKTKELLFVEEACHDMSS